MASSTQHRVYIPTNARANHYLLAEITPTDDFYTSLTADYVDSYQDDIAGLRGRQIDELYDAGIVNEDEERDVDSWLTIRANVGYDFENINLNFTVDNLFDEKPPVAYSSSRGFDSLNHNALGANYRLSMTYFF